MATKQWIERRHFGKGFQYLKQDTPVAGKQDLTYYKSLGIPPAWRNVQIAGNKRSKVLATGMDKAGRRQYIYHPSFRAQQEQHKFERILRFARALPEMRSTLAEHLQHRKLDREKALACAVSLLDQAYIRVGNDVYAKANQSYGLTTLRSRHTTVKGDTIIFDFIGKSGQEHVKKITDRTLARIIKKMDDLPGYQVFKYYDEDNNLCKLRSMDVNAYIKEIMGDEFSAKDFRTWAGTLIASAELAQAERAESERERKKIVSVCIQKVAKKLGNTPAIARSSYIDPRIINAYMDNDDLARIRKTVKTIAKHQELSDDEYCVLQLLEASKKR